MNPPVIVAGDCELHAWCGTCHAPTRVRLALHDGDPEGRLLAVVEVCPGCGSNHTTPMVEVVPQPQPRSLLAKLRRDPLPETDLCAYGDCRRKGKREHTYEIPADSGTYRYIFCKPGHRAAWAAENRLRD